MMLLVIYNYYERFVGDWGKLDIVVKHIDPKILREIHSTDNESISIDKQKQMIKYIHYNIMRHSPTNILKRIYYEKKRDFNNEYGHDEYSKFSYLIYILRILFTDIKKCNVRITCLYLYIRIMNERIPKTCKLSSNEYINELHNFIYFLYGKGMDWNLQYPGILEDIRDLYYNIYIKNIRFTTYEKQCNRIQNKLYESISKTESWKPMLQNEKMYKTILNIIHRYKKNSCELGRVTINVLVLDISGWILFCNSYKFYMNKINVMNSSIKYHISFSAIEALDVVLQERLDYMIKKSCGLNDVIICDNIHFPFSTSLLHNFAGKIGYK
ncbi:unnamed protein product [marine sediment metagenome]|uniref:Uncharacterized protein n=1 Tax=marine sediment metagenome TaxID=412755 RepID=X0STJ6_9ZZZZ